MQSFKQNFATRAVAWVLAFVMVFTMIPYGAFAEGKEPAGGTATRDAAPPIESDVASDAKNAVHGYAGLLVGGDVNAPLDEWTGQQFKPVEGIRVYFQWYEAKGNRVSPVYSAVSGADGQFHIGVKPYMGDDGKLIRFDADTTISAGKESYKMWVDESTIPEGYQLQYSTGESVEFTDRRVAGGGYNLEPNTLVNYRVLLMEIPKEDKMHKTAAKTGPWISNTGQGAIWGKVSWDYESAGGVQWGIVATHTSPANDVEVTASYLSDYALKKIYSPETATMLGLRSYKDIRGSGWTFKLETQLQNWIAEEVAKDKDKWIAETVTAKTNAEGDYKIQFKGTWGPNRNDYSVAEYSREAGKYYAGDAHRWKEEEAKRLGTVAENASDGSFLTGALDWNEKHVNSDWLFISTKGTQNLRVMTPWNNNWYTGSNNAWGIHGGWAQAAFGVSTVQAANSTRADFALAPAEIKFNITNYDEGANTAIPGDVAKTATAGLPYKNTSDSFRIVWYDNEGKVVKTENAAKPNAMGDFPEATFDTQHVKETKTFTAKLYRVDSKGNNAQLLAQDSFTVKVGRIVVSAYDDVNIANPAAKENEGATYKAEGLPEGLTINESTGTVSGKAAKPGKYNVTVTTSIEDTDAGEIAEGTSDYRALVTDSPLDNGEVGVEYKETVKPADIEGYVFKNVSAKFIDGKDIDGLTITKDQISGTPKAEVAATEDDPNVEVTYDIYKLNSKGEEVLIKEGHKDLVPLKITKAESQAPKYLPVYTDVEGTPGAEAVVAAPKFLDQKSTADPKPEVTTPPTGVKFALGDGAPQGATIDENTGEVKYTPTARDANTTVDIPVKVTYSDGTIDETVAKIKVGQAQADSYQPAYTEADAKAGTQTTITAPNFKDGDGKDAQKPDGTKFALGKDAPQGATIDEDTGKITFTPSIDQAGTTINIPVTVTYKDGSTDEVKAPVKVAEADNLNYEPDYKSVVAQVAHPVKVEAPKFLDKENNEANPQPKGMTFAIKEGFTANGNLTIDDKTGAITYTAVDADKDTVIEVPVVVTYADGSIESVTAKIDVPSDANFYSPTGKALTTEQGTVPPAKDGVEFAFIPPEDTKYEWQAVPQVNKAGKTTGTVKITYPDGTEDTVEVPVTVTASASKKTTVDDTNKKPVDPTGQKQGTGIVVTNPDETTKVTAKDKDGNSVPAVINKETGEIEVTPGTDATDPITVTVTDSDLPEGKKEIEVQVAEKSAQPEVTAPTAGDQTISGTGVKGSRIDLALKGGKGSEDRPIAKDVLVGQDGTWTAEVPAGMLLKENNTVVATQKESGKSVSDPVEAKVAKAPTDAEKNPAVKPDKTEVKDKNNLTDEEKAEVEQKVKDKNPEAKDVTVDDKGNVTITYPDNSTNTLTPEQTIVEKAKTDAEKNPAVDPAKTEVKDKTALTDEEKAKVEEAVKKANPEAKKVTVGDDGKATLTYEDGSTNEIPGSKTVTEKATDPQPGKTIVDDNNVKPVDPTNEPQNTGIVVTNSDDDTKVSAKDEDGKDIPASIDENGNVSVTPGKDVDGPITVTITDSGLPGKKVIEVPVNGHEKGRDDNRSDKGNTGGYWIIPSTPSKTDDKPKHETAIHKLYIYGYEDSTFRPEGNMTRAEAAAMLARLQGLDLSNKARPNFVDVRSGWYNAAINAVVNAGYMKGYPDGTFRPNGKITRAEFAQMIKAIDKANTGMAPFADAKGHWAEAAINQAYANDRIAGYPDGTFRPNNHITRAEAVTVFNKLYDRSVSLKGLGDVLTDIVPFNDVNTSHWAYYEIVESSNTHTFYRTEKGKVDETWVTLNQTWKQALANR